VRDAVVSFLALLPMRVWAELGAGVLAMCLFAGFVHHERKVGAEKVVAAAREAAAKATAANQAETQRREVAMKDISNEAQRLSTRAVDDAADARAAGDRLLDRARRGAAPGNPASAPGGAPGAAAVRVQPDMLRDLVQAAQRYAELADQRGIAGQACERSYDSLTR